MSTKRHQNVRFYSTKTFRLLCMITLTFAFFVIELVVGNITRSLALVADAFHMLSDLIALIIGLFVVRIAKRRSSINTFGWVRAEVVGANINAVFLLALCLTIVFDTIKRYIEPESIVNPTLLLIVGSIGLGINIVGLFLFQGFHGHTHGGEPHGHSHDGEAHGHSHDGEAHGHSHDGEAHGHSHDGEAHGHSHDGEAHEHSHDGEAHGHSHDGEAHGHSHDVIDQSEFAKKTKTSINIEEHIGKPDRNNATRATYSNDVEPLEVIIGPSEFKRHSLRALDEAIVDCTTHTQEGNDSPAHDSSRDPSSYVESGDSSTKSTKQKKASSMNMHGVFLHILADALGSVVVIISSLIIKFVPHDPNDNKHWTVYVDPTLSVLIVIIVALSAIPLFKETTYVLLQTVPKTIEVASLKTQLLEQVPEVDGIHDLHVWRLTSNAIIATAHLRRRSFTDYMTVANKVKQFFHDIGIHSTTIQYEQQEDENQTSSINNNEESGESKPVEIDCLLRCPDEACDMKTCCTKESIRSEGLLSTNNNSSAQKKSTNVLEVSVELPSAHSHNPTSINSTRIGMPNDGFIPERL